MNSLVLTWTYIYMYHHLPNLAVQSRNFPYAAALVVGVVASFPCVMSVCAVCSPGDIERLHLVPVVAFRTHNREARDLPNYSAADGSFHFVHIRVMRRKHSNVDALGVP